MFILNTFSVPCTQIGWIEAKLQNGNRWEGRSADFNIHEVVQGSPGADGGFHLSESFRLAVSVTHPINRFNLGLSTGRDTAVWDAISASMPCEIVGMSSTFCKSGCLILSVELKIPKLFYSLKKWNGKASWWEHNVNWVPRSTHNNFRAVNHITMKLEQFDSS